MVKLNDIIKVECIDLNHEGNGVCIHENFAIFVKGLLIGEVCECKITKVEKNFAKAIISKMIKTSKSRCLPICANFEHCGGCNLLHLTYDKQLEFKKNMVEQTLKRIGKVDIKVKEIIGAENPYYYRNKVQIPFGVSKNRAICGFYKQKTHDIIPLESCYIQPVVITEIARYIKNVCNDLRIPAYDEKTKKGSIRHVLVRKTTNPNASLDEYMVVLISKTEKVPALVQLVQKIVTKYDCVKSVILNVNNNPNNIILGDNYHLLYGKEVLIETLCGLKFEMSHKSFFQTNHEQTEKLYAKAMEYLDASSEDIILDSYCGVGTMALIASKNVKKVYGIEIVEDAIKDAKKNAKLNNITNCEFICGKSEEEVFNIKDVTRVIVDPPRKGLDIKMIEALNKMNVERLVYVSCDCATLARDINLLKETYEVKEVTAVDMFPNTCHVETVVLMSMLK